MAGAKAAAGRLSRMPVRVAAAMIDAQAPPARLERFFQSAQSAFARAALAAGAEGPLTRRYRLGRFGLRLEFASPALMEALSPALEHALERPPAAAPLAAEPAPAGRLVVQIWDSHSSGVAMPPCPWDWQQVRARGEVTGFEDEPSPLHLAAFADSGLLNMYDPRQETALYWLPDARSLPFHERAAPLRNILAWWLQRHGAALAHAAAVGPPGAGECVLLAGKGGSGKSTAALACLSRGWRYLSDDYCLLETHPQPVAASLYNSAKLRPEHLRRYAGGLGLPPLETLPADEKVLLYLQRHNPAQIAHSLPVRALLLPRLVDGGRTRLLPAAPAEALRALAPSSIFQLPGAGPQQFQVFSRLVGQLPCYWLEMARAEDLAALAQIPAAILQGL
jgi:hypothetical protein